MANSAQGTLQDCGVIYAVTGEPYFKEMRTSIRSIRAVHPDLPITVAYSWEGALARELLAGIAHIDFLDLTETVRASGLKMSDGMERSRGVKINTINVSPYRFTLFLDTDTYVRKTLVPMFDALREDDTQIVLTNEPIAYYPKEQYEKGIADGDRPNAQGLIALSNPKYFNSGVFAFRDTIRDYGAGTGWVEQFLTQSQAPATSNWARLCDQTALNKTMNRLTEIPRKVLSNTVWNAQCKILFELHKQGLWDDIHIIHCKMVHHLGPEPEKLVHGQYISSFELIKT
ncbi:hypothetical protein [Rhodobacter maris]|uniref:Glycosyl transferase family 2 n=1 Tax=Rhodobacter maris TaxID=446682 RepID=A0A285SG46_9RHOB|nr:hypothetical protein [Rhodobacter maris]SOC06877.1 hypothetical protein SAMN05877831_105169 [Rhodobacter maris]